MSHKRNYFGQVAKKNKKLIIAGICALLALIIGLGVGLGLKHRVAIARAQKAAADLASAAASKELISAAKHAQAAANVAAREKTRAAQAKAAAAAAAVTTKQQQKRQAAQAAKKATENLIKQKQLDAEDKKRADETAARGRANAAAAAIRAAKLAEAQAAGRGGTGYSGKYKVVTTGTCPPGKYVTNPGDCISAGKQLFGTKSNRAVGQPTLGYAYKGNARTKGCTVHKWNQKGGRLWSKSGGNTQFFPHATGNCGTANYDCICKA